MKIWFGRLTAILIVSLAIVTFIGLVAADKWWIQVFDFPRLGFSMLLVIGLIGLWLTRPRGTVALTAAALVSLAFQLYQLFPYSPVASLQATAADSCRDANRLRLLSVNVLQKNQDHQAVVDLVRSERPDMFLAMETDQRWIDALSGLADDYPHSRVVPLDNKYGMALYSRLPLEEVEVRSLIGDGTPAIRARVVTADGSRPTLFAVHPRPPHPGQGSGQRDAELIMLADLVRESDRPTIVMGDFNDVPWSSITESFQRIGQVVDPRVGRGYMASFNADNVLMRWPLDHIFHTDDFGVLRFELGPDIGSDHFPVIAELCQMESRFAPRQDVPELDADAREDAAEQLREGTTENVQDTADDLIER